MVVARVKLLFLKLSNANDAHFCSYLTNETSKERSLGRQKLDVSIQAQAIQHHLLPFWASIFFTIFPERIIELEPI